MTIAKPRARQEELQATPTWAATRRSFLLGCTPHQLLDQRGNALSDRFVGAREVLGHWWHFIPPHQLAARLIRPDRSQPMEITTSADSNSLGVTLCGINPGAG
jgi:hypothetical protein